MRDEEIIRKEIKRLEEFMTKPRLPQYKRIAMDLRIETLKWALGEVSMFDDEAVKS
jgi:hypothetical protein